MVRPQSIPDSWSDVLGHSSPLICGVLNVTPDSFSDGGQFLDRASCENQIVKIINDGAHIIDVGAESTRPGAVEIKHDDELVRLQNVFDVIGEQSFTKLFSIDTRHHQTAHAAIENGFHIINDVSGAMFDDKMPNVIAESNALCILMHMRGTPETMMGLSDYDNVVDDVSKELEIFVDAAIAGGVDRKKIMIDPGIGFGKKPGDNIALIENCAAIKQRLGLPMMVGVSRKSVVSFMLSGDTISAAMGDRDAKTAELSTYLADHGVDVIRVHDVARTAEALSNRKQ